MTVHENHVEVTVRSDLAGGVLPAVLAMLAARAECPLDRLDEALLLVDAVAAHAPGRSRDGHVRMRFAVEDGRLWMTVDGLDAGGAQGLVADATLPGVGDVFERIADEVDAGPADGDGERLLLSLRYAAPASESGVAM